MLTCRRFHANVIADDFSPVAVYHMSRKASIFLHILIVCIAAAIRLYFAVRCSAIPDFSDMGFYNEVAMQHGFPTSLPPGYPLFLRAIYHACGAYNYKAVYVIQGMLSALTVLLIYWTASIASSRKTGLLAAGIAAVYPNFIAYNLTTMTETIGLLLVMLLLVILVAAMSERKRSILAATVFFLGFTFRPAFVLFAPGVLLCLRKRRSFILAFVVLLGPLIAYEMCIGDTFHRSAVAARLN